MGAYHFNFVANSMVVRRTLARGGEMKLEDVFDWNSWGTYIRLDYVITRSVTFATGF